jgi:RNA polymerase sigma-70 factor (subfamily 1)
LRDNITDKTQHLITKVRGGDESALSQLCRVYGPRVHWIIRLRMGRELRSKLESIDLAQDAILCALEGLDDFTYKNEGDFVRWLSTIAENVLRGNLKKLHAGKRDIRREVPLEGYGLTTGNRLVGNPCPIDATTPSVIMSKKEDLDKLEKALDQLKPEYREVIVLTKIEGLSYKEIAERLGKSNYAVRKLVSRAMLALADVFESD